MSRVADCNEKTATMEISKTESACPPQQRPQQRRRKCCAHIYVQQGQAQLREQMEEFNSTCPAISQRSSISYGKDSRWRSNNLNWACLDPTQDPNCPFNCHFLSLETRCGILCYVMSCTLERGCVVPTENITGKPKYYCVYQDDRYPLLLDAVTRMPRSHWLPPPFLILK